MKTVKSIHLLIFRTYLNIDSKKCIFHLTNNRLAFWHTHTKKISINALKKIEIQNQRRRIFRNRLYNQIYAKNVCLNVTRNGEFEADVKSLVDIQFHEIYQLFH